MFQELQQNNLDHNECLLRNGHGPCQGSCRNTIGSYECYCEPGTQLAPDQHSCEDLDECSLNNHDCSHSCLNTVGTAFCSCPDGYMLEEDWKTCEDVNECDLEDIGQTCTKTCINTIGSYYCSSDGDGDFSTHTIVEEQVEETPFNMGRLTSNYSLKPNDGKHLERNHHSEKV